MKRRSSAAIVLEFLAKAREQKRKRGGQPGNRNALKHGRTTARAKALRAEIFAVRAGAKRALLRCSALRRLENS